MNIHRCYNAVYVSGGTVSTLSDLKLTEITDALVQVPAGGVTAVLLDPLTIPNASEITLVNTGECNVQFNCNIHVEDDNGTDVETATVLCEDKDGGEIFSVTTNGSGDITEQQVNHIKWVDAAKTETVYYPLKFTISKTGYDPVVIDNVTPVGAIDWELTLPFMPPGGSAQYANPGGIAI